MFSFFKKKEKPVFETVMYLSDRHKKQMLVSPSMMSQIYVTSLFDWQGYHIQLRDVFGSLWTLDWGFDSKEDAEVFLEDIVMAYGLVRKN